MAGEAQHGGVGGAIDVHRKRQLEARTAAAARVGWARDPDRRLVPTHHERHQPATPRVAPARLPAEVARQVGERAVRAQQVWYAEARQHPAAGHRVGREGVRHPQHDHRNALGGRDLPERLAVTPGVALGRGGLERVHPEAGRAHPARPHVRQIRLRIPLDEVEDPVPRRRRAGRERRPRHRRLRRVRRGERPEVAAPSQRAQLRQLALVHPTREQLRIDPVEAEDHEPARELSGGRFPLPTAARCPPNGRRECDGHHHHPQKTLLLGELPVELARVARHTQAARRELVEVLRLPVQEPLLLERTHVGGERLEGQPQLLRQPLPCVQVRALRRRVMNPPVFEQNRPLEIHDGEHA